MKVDSALKLVRHNSYTNEKALCKQQDFCNWCEASNEVFRLGNDVQLNSCNSNSYNLKDHLNQTNSSVLSEFTSKPVQENSFNSNSHNSKNHLNQTNVWVHWTDFSSCNSNFGFEV